ncbi:MerR family transcriptional regulator [Cohnella luojiensis]|uniref:MerR family transcriptional regulator n=1 Tax=Cohnella luojiensis TaxID=652876 RepID=A0A4Y8LYM6_9BACL|nr:MerR family transcriptional regulator [Cohnella luojiensis]TFE26327.1 MerR family transcriptional regulator [Cohnella luojiensis]
MMTIGEVAEKSGLSTSALRYYEQIGLIPTPERINGRRIFSDDILSRLETIRLAQSAGFQIDEIKQLLEGFDSNVPPSERWRVMALKKQEELDEQINQMLKMKSILSKSLGCSCLSWEECFSEPASPQKITTIKRVNQK